MIKIVKTHRKSRRSQFHLFSSFAWFIKICSENCCMLSTLQFVKELNKVNFVFLKALEILFYTNVGTVSLSLFFRNSMPNCYFAQLVNDCSSSIFNFFLRNVVSWTYKYSVLLELALLGLQLTLSKLWQVHI